MRGARHPRNSRRPKPKVISGGPVRLVSTKKLQAKASPDSASQSSNNESGLLRPDTEQLKDPGEFNLSALLPGGIMLTITLLALIFIAIITWFVSQMPAD